MGLILLGFIATSIQLVPDGTLLLHLIIIVLMVWVLNRTLFKPINQILEERERRGEGLMSEAAKLAVSVEESLRSYEQTLRGARAEGYSRLEQERAEAIRSRESQLGAAKVEVNELIATEKQQIAKQVEQARGTLAQEARKLAIEISTRILGRPVKQ
jgi:F-type H+-transporting ATPase subunit b